MAVSRRQESLGTRDHHQAERLRAAKESAVEQPHANLAIGKAYLSAHDPQLVQPTWQTVMEEFSQRGQPQTRERKVRAMRGAPFRRLANRKLVDTTADDLRQVLALGRPSTKLFLRCLHNLALGMGRLAGPIIPSKLWPATKPRIFGRGYGG